MIQAPFLAYILVFISWIFYWKNELNPNEPVYSIIICLISVILALIVGGWGVVLISVMFLVAFQIVCVAMLPIAKHLDKEWGREYDGHNPEWH